MLRHDWNGPALSRPGQSWEKLPGLGYTIGGEGLKLEAVSAVSGPGPGMLTGSPSIPILTRPS